MTIKKFINYPKKVDKSFYVTARDSIVNYFSDDNFLESIYEYGSVSSPGISDIDIILVFKKDPKNIFKYSFSDINKDVYDLVANGNVIKMEKSTFASLNYIDQLNTNLLSGNHINKSILSEKFIDIRELISICDWLPERIKRVEMALSGDVINISYLLCLIHSLNYSIKKVEQFTEIINDFQYLEKTLTSLRSSWYKIKEPEKILLEVSNNSIEIGLKAINLISKIIIKYIPLFKNQKDFKLSKLVVPMHHSIFLNFKEKLDFDSLEHFRKNKEIIFPGIFALHFLHLAHLPTLISRRLSLKLFKKFTNPILNIENNYHNYLYIKASLISDNLSFLEKNNFDGGLIRYGFYS